MADPDFASRVGTNVPFRERINQNPTPQSASHPDGDWAKLTSAARCWAQTGDAFFPVTQVTEKLPPGAYRCKISPAGPFVERMNIDIDNLLALPDSAVSELLAEFDQFWKLRGNFADRGFIHKRGMLFWGPPGAGKTSGIWQMTQKLVRDLDGIVVFVEDPVLATTCLSFIRRIEPSRPIVCVMEDIDALINQHGEHGYLALLDGETQISNVVHVATTNYPENLDKRFVDRPSRLDTIKYVGMPTAEARAIYLKAKEPSLDDMTVARWVRLTDGYSVAHLREVIIAIKCFEQPEAEVFKRLNSMREDRLTSDGQGGDRRRAGFNA